MKDDHLANLHRSFYREPSVTAFYDKKRALYAPETTVFEKFKDKLQGSRFLDLGIGAGRTTEHILAFTQDYVGIDYVPEMIDAAKKRFPEVDLRVGDARELTMFEDASFDVILFSFNGLDTLTEEDRLLILKEVRRLLRPDGLFIFSTHNRSKPVSKPWHSREFSFSANPVRLAKNTLYFLQGLNNYRSRQQEQWENQDRACWLDTGTNFSAPLYFITQHGQTEQLRKVGFEPVMTVSQDGRPADPQGIDRQSSWIYFVCRTV